MFTNEWPVKLLDVVLATEDHLVLPVHLVEMGLME